jgi:hypothetical protein
MQKLNTWIACFIISITTPAIALATPNHETKSTSLETTYTSDSSLGSLISDDKEFSEKSIISSTKSHDSFQEASELQSKWGKQRDRFEGKDDFTEVEHDIGNLNKWVTGQKIHKDNESFHEHFSFEKEFEHGEHGIDDEHFTQPVPELGTYLMFLIGVISIATIKRRQYSRSI